MIQQTAFTLVNPINGNLAFKLFYFDNGSHFDHLQRLNYYSIILVNEGEGKLRADFSEYKFMENTMMCFTPYQPFMINSNGTLKGISINFHPDFFCIHKHHRDVACSGVLFNNIYQPPTLPLSQVELPVFFNLIEQMKTEVQNAGLAQYELLVSYLKIFLINASRLKISQNPIIQEGLIDNKEPFILQNLKDSIEIHFKTKHSAGEYADLLNISSKALAKISKVYFNKTLTDLISERIIIEAKRELYLTSKAVKQIAFELGFNDEYYFSRFFKIHAEISPQFYRDTVGYAKAEVEMQ